MNMYMHIYTYILRNKQITEDEVKAGFPFSSYRALLRKHTL